MIRFKVNALALLKEKGISSYRLRQDKLLGQATITQLRRGELVSLATLDWLCSVLGCQPGDLLEYVDDDQADHD